MLTTAIKYWLNVPAKPALWKCFLVAWATSKFEFPKNKMGSVDLGYNVQYDDDSEFEDPQTLTPNKE